MRYVQGDAGQLICFNASFPGPAGRTAVLDRVDDHAVEWN
jgi:phosphoribosyl-dephospho-CoA transferase